MAEDHWGEAISDRVGPTPESDAAVDTETERAEAHRHEEQDVQSIISRVAADHSGGSKAVILANLQRELVAHGHWPQPQPWLNAVADEMESGHHYQVGTE